MTTVAGPSTSNADALVAMEVGYKQLQTPKQAMEIIRSAHSLFKKFKVLFADGIFSFKDRQDGQAKRAFSFPKLDFGATVARSFLFGK